MSYVMSEKVKGLYAQLIEQFKPTHGSDCGVFVTHKGSTLPEKHILFVGRETNGIGTSLEELKSLPYAYMEADVTEGHLDWLVDGSYSYSTSPFWRTVGKTASEVFDKEYDGSIFNSVSWANLYRVAMCEKDGRINGSMKDAQRKLCADLLIEEIRELKPSAMVFLTGDWLDSFYDGDKEWSKLGYIQNFTDENCPLYIGKFDFNLGDGLVIPTIVVPHPQGKKEEDILPHVVEYVKSKFNN